MREIAIVLFALSFAFDASAQGWIGFTPVDAATMPDYLDFRANSPNGYRTASGDFDGDGRPDAAGFYTRGDELVLAVRLAASPDVPVVIWDTRTDHARYFGVETAAPGVHRTACSRYWRCEPGERSEVQLTHDGIMLLAFEGPAEFLYFRTANGFEYELIRE
jgi:hypothetical protein